MNTPALLGGTPLSEKPLHLVRPPMPELSSFISGMEKLARTRILSNQGAFVQELEKKLADELGVQHCALFCSGTTAIMCLAKALELNGEVIVPSFTFAATAQALEWQGIRPEVCRY